MGGVLTRRPMQQDDTLDQLLKDGSLILFRGDGEDMLVLNPLAALIWDASTGHDTVEAIVRGLQTHFPEQTSLEGDVLACLDALVGKGFLIWVEQADQ